MRVIMKLTSRPQQLVCSFVSWLAGWLVGWLVDKWSFDMRSDKAAEWSTRGEDDDERRRENGHTGKLNAGEKIGIGNKSLYASKDRKRTISVQTMMPGTWVKATFFRAFRFFLHFFVNLREGEQKRRKKRGARSKGQDYFVWTGRKHARLSARGVGVGEQIERLNHHQDRLQRRKIKARWRKKKQIV